MLWPTKRLLPQTFLTYVWFKISLCFSTFEQHKQCWNLCNLCLMPMYLYIPVLQALYYSKRFQMPFVHFTPNIHVQVVHASSRAQILLEILTLVRLKNEVVECKHQEVKNLYTWQRAKECGLSVEIWRVGFLPMDACLVFFPKRCSCDYCCSYFA